MISLVSRGLGASRSLLRNRTLVLLVVAGAFGALAVGGERGDLAERLAVERGLLGLPGPFFGPGQERHLRLAFANAELPMIGAIAARVSNDVSARV